MLISAIKMFINKKLDEKKKIRLLLELRIFCPKSFFENCFKNGSKRTKIFSQRLKKCSLHRVQYGHHFTWKIELNQKEESSKNFVRKDGKYAQNLHFSYKIMLRFFSFLLDKMF